METTNSRLTGFTAEASLGGADDDIIVFQFAQLQSLLTSVGLPLVKKGVKLAVDEIQEHGCSRVDEIDDSCLNFGAKIDYAASKSPSSQ